MGQSALWNNQLSSGKIEVTEPHCLELASELTRLIID